MRLYSPWERHRFRRVLNSLRFLLFWYSMGRLLYLGCSLFDQLGHRLLCEAALIGRAHVRCERRIGAVARDGLDLFVGAAKPTAMPHRGVLG